jgi:hypothetical protein
VVLRKKKKRGGSVSGKVRVFMGLRTFDGRSIVGAFLLCVRTAWTGGDWLAGQASNETEGRTDGRMDVREGAVEALGAEEVVVLAGVRCDCLEVLRR